ncbi:MAG TPA: sigma-70 family RNA polymerase sigma factor [Leeuwenhoekiella sp.]|nr:sigma-70 family RNA polymerase sigma factor [Leeuwenhoekiella sp.]
MSINRRRKTFEEKKIEKDAQKMELLFKEHYTLLCLVSFGIVKDRDAAKDIAQDFFIYYWQRRGLINLTVSFKAYAVRAVKNLSLLSLEKTKKENLQLQDLNVRNHQEQKDLDEPGKYQKLNELLNKLPKSRKDIFISFVVHGQSYSEIAQDREISVNTVKTQMKRAYAFLRAQATQDMLPLFALMFSAFLLEIHCFHY